ncbi:hypothetical protein M2454_002832 [Aequitasia blattaphilus]
MIYLDEEAFAYIIECFIKKERCNYRGGYFLLLRLFHCEYKDSEDMIRDTSRQLF